MIIATNIKTELWNRIIKQFVKDDWIPTFIYDNFDAGIDWNFIILEKDQEEIIFGWDNWFEGEIKCNKFRMLEIEKTFDCKFSFGDPECLKPNFIELHRKLKSKNKMNNPSLIKNLLK